MNILLNTVLMVAGGPLVSDAVADQVLKSDSARAGGFVRDSIIDKKIVTTKWAAKRSSIAI